MSTLRDILDPHVATEISRPQPASTLQRRVLKVLRPPTNWPRLQLDELWNYRDLLFMLVWRDLSANYRQSVIGYGWALFKPAVSVVIFTLVFGKVVGLENMVPAPEGLSERQRGLFYAMFCLCGLLPWMYFATALTSTSNSVVQNGHLLSKVYFPRLALPAAAICSGLMELLVQLALVLLLLFFVQTPGLGVLLTPLLILYAAITALSVGLWLTALNVKYRDIGQMVPFLIQMWMWLTPIVYPLEAVPERWRFVLALNPMTGVVLAFRWSLLGGGGSDLLELAPCLAASFGATLALFIGGLFYFRRTEQTFADLI